MIEIQIRKPCSQPAPNRYTQGHLTCTCCPECGAYSYRQDGDMVHELVISWMSATDLLAEMDRLSWKL